MCGEVSSDKGEWEDVVGYPSQNLSDHCAMALPILFPLPYFGLLTFVLLGSRNYRILSLNQGIDSASTECSGMDKSWLIYPWSPVVEGLCDLTCFSEELGLMDTPFRSCFHFWELGSSWRKYSFTGCRSSSQLIS